MNIADAKQIDIDDFLQRQGHMPTRRTSRDIWYLSPIRDENHASFHTKHGQIFYDFGLGVGGNIITLAHFQANSANLLNPNPSGQDVSDALNYIESVMGTGYSMPTQRQVLLVQHDPAYIVETSRPLADSRGEQWCRSRALDPDSCRPFLSDVYFNRAEKPYKKPLYGVGLPNLSGGFEIRTKLDGGGWIKSSVGPKDVTVFKSERKNAFWMCFEGMPDFCTYLTVKGPSIRDNNYIVLNGTGMTGKAIDYLKTPPEGYLVICSQAGKGAQESKEKLQNFVAESGWDGGDIDHYWEGHEDYNAWLMDSKGMTGLTVRAELNPTVKQTPKLGQ